MKARFMKALIEAPRPSINTIEMRPLEAYKILLGEN